MRLVVWTSVPRSVTTLRVGVGWRSSIVLLSTLSSLLCAFASLRAIGSDGASHHALIHTARIMSTPSGSRESWAACVPGVRLRRNPRLLRCILSGCLVVRLIVRNVCSIRQSRCSALSTPTRSVVAERRTGVRTEGDYDRHGGRSRAAPSIVTSHASGCSDIGPALSHHASRWCWLARLNSSTLPAPPRLRVSCLPAALSTVEKIMRALVLTALEMPFTRGAGAPRSQGGLRPL